MLKLVTSLAAILALVAAPTQADIAMSVLDQPFSPIQFEGCYVTAGAPLGYVWHLPGDWVDGGLAVRFRNRTTKDVTAVVFNFAGFDRSGKYRDTVFHVIRGRFSPDIEIDDAGADRGFPPPSSMWPITGFNDNTTAILCSVQAVLFSDGSLWQKNDLRLRCHIEFLDRGYCTTPDLIPLWEIP